MDHQTKCKEIIRLFDELRKDIKEFAVNPKDPFQVGDGIRTIEALIQNLSKLEAVRVSTIAEANTKFTELEANKQALIDVLNNDNRKNDVSFAKVAEKATKMEAIPMQVKSILKKQVVKFGPNISIDLPIKESISDAKNHTPGEIFIISTMERPYAPFYKGNQQKWLFGMNLFFGTRSHMFTFYMADVYTHRDKDKKHTHCILHNDYRKFDADINAGRKVNDTFFVPGANILKLASRFDFTRNKIIDTDKTFVKCLNLGDPETMDTDLQYLNEESKYIYDAVLGHMFTFYLLKLISSP